MTMFRLTTGAALVAAQLSSVPALAADTPNTLRRATERACIQEGRQQGLHVQRVGEVEAVGDSGGEATASRALLSVKRDGRAYKVWCHYSPVDRVARITPVGQGGAGATAA